MNVQQKLAGLLRPAIIAVGSGDGVLTAAATLRTLRPRIAQAMERAAQTPCSGAGSEKLPLALGVVAYARSSYEEVPVVFTQAFEVAELLGDRPGTKYLDLALLGTGPGACGACSRVLR